MKKGLVALALLFFVATALSHDHSHGHSHDHSHSHSHEHAQPRQPRPKIPETSKYEVQKEEPVPVAQFRPTGVWSQALLATALIGVAPILILFVVPLISVDDKGRRVVNHSLLKTLLGFAVGGLLGDVFLHLLPHAMNPHGHGEEGGHSHGHGHAGDDAHDHSEGVVLGLVILAGIFSFFIIEKIMRIRSSGGHGHSHSHGHSKKDDDAKVVEKESPKNLRSREKGSNQGSNHGSGQASQSSTAEAHTSKVTAYLNMIADAAHNFTDGMAIGASFLIHPTVGWSTTVAVFFHEIPHELGDYAILVQSGYSKHKAMLVQLGTALGAVLGTIVALIAGGQLESVAKYILPFTAGGFIYIATVDVIPELLEDTSVGQTIMELITMSLGVGIMALIAIFE